MKVPLTLLFVALASLPCFSADEDGLEALRNEVDEAREAVGHAHEAMRKLYAELKADCDLLRSDTWPLVREPYLEAIRRYRKTKAPLEEAFLAAGLLSPTTTRRLAAEATRHAAAAPTGEGPPEARVLARAVAAMFPKPKLEDCWEEIVDDDPVVVAWRKANERVAAADAALDRARRAERGEPDSPPGMKLVDRGRFHFGPWEGWVADLEANKERRRTLDAFYMDVHEVTNEEFRAFLAGQSDEARIKAWLPFGFTLREDGAPVYAEGTGRHPVRGLPFLAARAYARSLGKRLPTEEEWEKAARGPRGLVYPWGDEFESDATNWSGRGLGRPTAVGACDGDVSPYGIRDMGGNVSEMTSDLSGREPAGEKLDSADNLVYRGGSYAEGKDQTKATYRWVMTATKKSPEKVGFRCVMSERDFKRKK